jgi:homoserine dehydrogenase
VKLALIGFGVVGQGLAEILHDQGAFLRETQGFEAQIVAVATQRRGTLYHPDGLEIGGLLSAIGQGHLDHYPARAGLNRNWDALRLIRESSADVMVESTHSNFQNAQPSLDYCRTAFESGKHVVLANKGPVALAYDELTALAHKTGKKLAFEATVMAGTPSIRLAMEALAGCQISEARGILNGTTNYILTQMESGMAYNDALAQAQQLGYAEADPTADVEGWDAAGKTLIVANAIFGKRLALSDLQVKGISEISQVDVEAARQAGERWKLIARVTPEGGSVQPVRLPISDPLANVFGVTNAITYTTNLLGNVTLIGAGAGRLQTGFGLLSDLMAIQRST